MYGHNTCKNINVPTLHVICVSHMYNGEVHVFHSHCILSHPLILQVHSNNLLPPPHRQTNGFHNIPNFSLNGLLDKMHNHTYLYHNQGIDHTHNQIGEGRVTDYPIAYIGNHGNQSFQSETDSLSTYSESSFTSDSSFAYDANRKPKKKILKKSNGASRSKHKRRVTWNLDHLESFSDVDSISIDSSSSISSCGPSYRLPGHPRRNGGGQEPGRNVTMVTEYPHYQHQGHRLFSPPPTSAATPFSNNAGFSGKNSHPGIYRTYSGSIYQPKSSGGHRHAHQTNSLDSNYSRGRSLSLSYQDLQHPPVQHSSPGSHTEGGGREKRVINVPILQLEDVPELNESNPEEREKRRLFEFPPQPNHKYPPTHCPVDLTGVPNGTGQRSRSSSYDSNPQSLTSNSSSSMSSQSNSSFSAFLPASFRNLPPAAGSPSMATTNRFQGNFPLKCVPEDEPDYDHLEDNSPKISGKKTAKYHLEPCIPNNQWYSNDDIEEALQILEESEQESGDERGPPPSSSSTPPPVPPKQRRIVRNPPPVLVKKPHLKNLPKPISLSTKKRDDTKTGVLSLSPAPQRPRGSNVDHLVKPDPLHSPSSETLMPVDASQSDSNLTPLEAEVHPKVNGNCSPKLSWSNPMDDRIIEGAEDLRQSPTHIPVNPSTGFITKSNTIHVDSVGKLAKNMEGLKTADQSSSPLQRHNSFSPTRQQKESSESPRHHQLQRSRTLPRNLGLSKEDEAVLQWYRRRPQMKPLIVDTDKEIDEMMEEMEREKGTPHQARRQPVEPQPPQTIGNVHVHIIINMYIIYCINI